MSRPSQPTLLVLTEGEPTEVIYLPHLNREHRERVAVIIDNRRGTPLTIESSGQIGRAQVGARSLRPP